MVINDSYSGLSNPPSLSLTLIHWKMPFQLLELVQEKRNTPHRPTYAAAASARLHTHAHTDVPAPTWILSVSCRRASAHTHTHTQTICRSYETGVLRCRLIYKPLSLSLSLSPTVESGFCPTHTHTHTHTHTLSFSLLRGWNVTWPVDWKARGPLRRRERWWKDGPVKPFCCLYCVQAQWRTALYGVLNAAYCANFSVNLGQLQHTFFPSQQSPSALV